MSAPLDLLILGGGCAGLSLARQLAALGERCPRVELIEQRSEYCNDRSWCFWAASDGRASREWSRIRLRWGTQSLVCDCGATPYQLVRADHFAADALAEIGRNSALTVTLGATVLASAQREGIHYRVETSVGTRRSRWVIDTRPGAAPVEGGALLWQSFLGWELATELPLFDPGVVELMDFNLPAADDPDAVRFLYVLPLSATQALIEPTVFSRAPQTAEQLEALLRAVLHDRFAGAGYRLLRRESGVLPMGLQHGASEPGGEVLASSFAGSGLMRAGLAAGAARSSTGYAYLRIQHWAQDCATRIAAGRSPCPQPRDRLLQRAMDTLFLAVLRRQPRLGPRLFFTLFAAVSTERVIRFLSDRATWGDVLRVVWALPAAPFLSALWRRAWRLPGAVLPRAST